MKKQYKIKNTKALASFDHNGYNFTKEWSEPIEELIPDSPVLVSRNYEEINIVEKEALPSEKIIIKFTNTPDGTKVVDEIREEKPKKKRVKKEAEESIKEINEDKFEDLIKTEEVIEDAE